mmetsp:Transcript_45450/g.73756  ORF Transcript_45450/g.73756 Transcript_45450/m.73756 type:complete len:372 (+) Transcript_45450:898-2013(+)
MVSQKLMEDGSPPCSPQMPIFMPGRTARPLCTAIFSSSPTPSWSRLTKGSCSTMPLALYSGRKLPASSLLRPQVDWVRSFVPKLKNSATEAIGPAWSAALGSSIMVPMWYLMDTPCSACTFTAVSSMITFSSSISWTVATKGTITSATGGLPDSEVRATSAAASKMARACISQISGNVTARRQPRWPSIGFVSRSSEALRRMRSKGTPEDFATEAIAVSVCGMNSCRGGSSSRTVTGRPSMMRKSFTMSERCITRSLARAARRPVSSEARIISRIATMRSPSKNICSVRTRPIPSAPKSFAAWASSGVSALARTCMRRNSSAHNIMVAKLPPSFAGTVGISPSITSPVVPSMVRTSPCLMVSDPMVRDAAA